MAATLLRLSGAAFAIAGCVFTMTEDFRRATAFWAVSAVCWTVAYGVVTSELNTQKRENRRMEEFFDREIMPR